MEVIFKNEIKKSRSLQFRNILDAYMARYNHILHYPFRNRVSDKVDLLKPKSTFFNLIFVNSVCVAWTCTIFLSAILQSVYTNVSAIPLMTYAALTVLIGLVSSFINVFQINRLFRLYAINVKHAFKVDYGHKYVSLEGGI